MKYTVSLLAAAATLFKASTASKASSPSLSFCTGKADCNFPSQKIVEQRNFCDPYTYTGTEILSRDATAICPPTETGASTSMTLWGTDDSSVTPRSQSTVMETATIIVTSGVATVTPDVVQCDQSTAATWTPLATWTSVIEWESSASGTSDASATVEATLMMSDSQPTVATKTGSPTGGAAPTQPSRLAMIVLMGAVLAIAM